MSTSSRTNLAVLIYEQTFTNCVCFCYRKNTKKLQQPRHVTSDAVIKHDVQEWFKFGVKYDGGHQTVAAWPLHRRRRNQTQTITCFNFGHRCNADNGMERLVLKWQSRCHVKWHTSAQLSCFVIFVFAYSCLYCITIVK